MKNISFLTNFLSVNSILNVPNFPRRPVSLDKLRETVGGPEPPLIKRLTRDQNFINTVETILTLKCRKASITVY